ncbi:hypothetical protein V5F32_02935 [Xanthobacter oligotrophicus]|uniref:Uncharacterized protein n=1 Tax=Xanthobacter oligotrophicus TaxID=2607286 RepID=A0ABW6ZQW0_9HYPH
MVTHVTSREMCVLEGLCLGNADERNNFPGIGEKTFSDMIEKGWIENTNPDERSGTVGIRLTPLEDKVFTEAAERGVQPLRWRRR